MIIPLILSYVSFRALFLQEVHDTPVSYANHGEVSITFDDGPHREHSEEVLDILRDKHVHATFFVIGNRILRHEDILRRELSEWHTIWNHSYSHPIFKKLSLFHLATEILRTDYRIFLATGTTPRYFRFPYGVEDYRIWYFHTGPIIGWNVDAYDWKARNPKILAKNIIQQTKSGSIILLHDIKTDTVAALPDIIDGIRAKWYTIVPLKKLLRISLAKNTHNILYRSQKNTIHLSQKIKSQHIPSTESIITPWQPKITTEISSW